MAIIEPFAVVILACEMKKEASKPFEVRAATEMRLWAKSGIMRLSVRVR